jgi:hypothetical protein
LIPDEQVALLQQQVAHMQESIEALQKKKRRESSSGRPKPAPRYSDPRPKAPPKRKSSGAASLPQRRPSGDTDDEYDGDVRAGGRVVTDEMKRDIAKAMEDNEDSNKLMKAIDIIRDSQPDLMKVRSVF